MEIVNNYKPTGVLFRNVTVGTVFLYNNRAFLKIPAIIQLGTEDEFSAIILATGEPTDFFPDTSVIIPNKVKMIIE